jgi:exopolyphosphatase/guanosine-5'-triphosphate,3'-diphosphate pyrophosphatase
MFVSDVVAALDCGSNSTRLLIANHDGAQRREMRITRLSQGVDATSSLLPEAMERTFTVLRDYRDFMDAASVRRGLLVATSAVRDAHNGDDFLDGAKAIVGVNATILEGAEEARLSYVGATLDLDTDERPTMILDIGGGSTEMAVELGGVLHSYSMQLGCVRVTERALGSGVVTSDRDLAARQMISSELDRAFDAVPAFNRLVGNVRLVGLAGSVATLAQLDTGLKVYDRSKVHHHLMSRGVVDEWQRRLAGESPAERLRETGMVPGREDVLTAGLYVLAAVMDRFETLELLSSENDILDGITRSLLT